VESCWGSVKENSPVSCSPRKRITGGEITREVKMGIADIVVMALILGGASYLFYRSVVKKKGHCQGCGDMGTCEGKKRVKE
jgi:hypothetical protein